MADKEFIIPIQGNHTVAEIAAINDQVARGLVTYANSQEITLNAPGQVGHGTLYRLIGDGPGAQFKPLAVDGAGNLSGVSAHLRDFGALSDGVTDDLSSFKRAVEFLNNNGGGTLHLTEGDTALVFGAADTVALSGIKLVGAGKGANLRCYSDIPGESGMPGPYRRFLSVTGSDVEFENINFFRMSPFSQTVMIYWSAGMGLYFTQCTVFGYRGVTNSVYSHFLQFPESGSVGDLVFDRCEFSGNSFNILMTNSATSTVDNVLVTKCLFFDNYADDLGFNSPIGLIKNITVENSSFLNNKVADSSAGFAIAFAHCLDALVKNCTFSGYNNEPLHVEDYSENITFSDCRLRYGGLTTGAYIQVISGSKNVLLQSCMIDSTANTNVSGLNCINIQAGGGGLTPGGRPSISPERVTIDDCDVLTGTFTNGIYLESVLFYQVTNNRIRGNGNVSGGVYGGSIRYGIYAYTGSLGNFSGNIISGFLYAFRPSLSGVPAWGAGTTIRGNRFRNCYFTMSLLDMDPGCVVDGNTVFNCVKPGVFGKGSASVTLTPIIITNNHARSCTDPFVFNGVHTIKRTASGTSIVGAINLSVLPTDVFMPSGTVLNFSGGGVFTLSSGAVALSTSLVGLLATANVAPNETATFTATLPVVSGVTNNLTS